MLKKIALFALSCFPTFFSLHALPEIIDAEVLQAIVSPEDSLHHLKSMPEGKDAFNYAPELIPFFSYVKKLYGLELAVETGTYKGNTTTLLSQIFDSVHTFEINASYYTKAQAHFASYHNIHSHLGSSAENLREFLPTVKNRRTLFYLDAHWQNYWPLLNELEVISKTHRDNCIIVVDDIKVPNRPDIPYDVYGKDECSYEYIQDKLDKIFSSYTIHYLIPNRTFSHAKLVAIPKRW